MEKKTILIEQAEPLLLFGFNDIYLRKIEQAFPDTQITARGNQVHLSGTKDSIVKIERLLIELIVLLNRNGNLTENDVDTVLTVSASRTGSLTIGSGGQNTILFTASGGEIKAKSPNQARLVDRARKNDIVFSIGPAGTGKTYTAVALAVAALKSRQVERIILCRPAVEAGERLGFLPGDLRDKVDPYLRPLYDALGDMLPVDKLKSLLDQNIIEIAPLAYMRGRTLSRAFVILDEAQNATAVQMKMFLTRLGPASRAIITGDITQMDLPSNATSGLVDAIDVLGNIKGIEFVYFDENDVVRHRLVKEIIGAYARKNGDKNRKRSKSNGPKPKPQP